MAKKSKGRDWHGGPIEFLRGGKDFPKSLLRSRIAEVKRRLSTQFKEKSAIQREAAQYWSKLAPPIPKGPEATRALNGLRGISDQLAKKKLVVPAPPAQQSRIIGPNFFATVTPPYDYAFALPQGNLQGEAASADKNSGQLSVSAVTDFAKPSSPFAYAETGIYFRPVVPAGLRVWASPAFAFSWSVNSLSMAYPAEADILGSLTILGEQGTDFGPRRTASQFFPGPNGVSESITQGLAFDFQSNPGTPLFAELEVDPSFFYVLYVCCDCDVIGEGWPGSLATASLSVTVPFITFEVSLQPIIGPATQG